MQHPSNCTEQAVFLDAAEDLDTPALDLTLVPPALLRLALLVLDPLDLRIDVLGSGVRPRADDLEAGLEFRAGAVEVGKIGTSGTFPVS